MGKQKTYYLGLDIGTDSVGYAVTDPAYNLLKFKGEPMWGSHLFEAGQTGEERRLHRTARRRIDRRQQRVALVGELFAPEIGKIDPDFFKRRKESALYGEESRYAPKLFSGDGITDKEYHDRYPTIHHLILELMTSWEPHDVRLVYLACAWLVAHRGHFLFDFAPDQIDRLLDFNSVYKEFCEFFLEQDYTLPWDASISADDILEILNMDTGVRRKQDAFKAKLYKGKKISKETSEEFPYNRDALVTLLSGGSVKAAILFNKDGYVEVDSVSVQMGDEDFDRIVGELEEDGELLIRLRSLHNCARLIRTMANKREGDPVCISSSKVAIYERHCHDLNLLKRLVRKYCPDQYDEIFRTARSDNYVAYSRNTKSCPNPKEVKGTNKDVFSDYLKKKLKSLKVQPEDQAAYEDMMTRLESRSFLPKQKDTDNRIVPQQLYRQEMAEILNRAESYLPLLSERDEDGLSIKEKLLSIFDFRIPYYVGPLIKRGNGTAWIERKQGKILPWNFRDMVDLDKCEQNFIDQMINDCTYLPGKEVLPAASLMYETYTVLNELNNLKIDGREIPVAVKQDIFQKLFLNQRKVTVKNIQDHLLQQGLITSYSQVSGLDITVKSALHSRCAYRKLLESGALTEAQVERIIRQAAYTEDKGRLKHWLKAEYPQLSDPDISYILKQRSKGFGRLSAALLSGIHGAKVDSDGEAFTILEGLWNTNKNLMQLLSEQYTFMDQIRDYCKEYYSEHPKSLTDRLSDMYVSNAVKRPIFRTLNIVSDVVKAAGGPPTRIFVEMARGGTPEQQGKRTQSRQKQLLDLYKNVKDDDSRRLAKELEAMGTAADNRLQDRKLYLYYLQLGKCAYTGNPIDLSRLSSGDYNLEHIYPQSQVKDDSLLNNLVLVKSEVNGQKDNIYPVNAEIQKKMDPYWQLLKHNGLMTEEKYRRLTRKTPFTAEEKMGFINRQLVETRQSTKVISTFLKERFPETEIVYVKAGLVSEYRQEFKLVKCRSVNDLHHAKDAYLNVVVGNVYHERFTSKWFRLEEHYNVQVKKLFSVPHQHDGVYYWNGEADLSRVRKTMEKNAIHLTRYAFCRKGGLFDQQPVKAAEGLVPLKEDLPTEKYGGYNKAAATCYLLARFTVKGKWEVMLVPVELRFWDKASSNADYALVCAEETIEKILNTPPQNTELLLGGRFLKINTVFSVDGTRMTLAGKSSGGTKVLLSPLAALLVSPEWERYAKSLENFQKKTETNKNLQPDEAHDGISREKNLAFYRVLTEKLNSWPFVNYPGGQGQTLTDGFDQFAQASVTEQIMCLMNILQLMGSGSGGVDLQICGGTKKAGAKMINAKLSNWAKRYQNVRIVDESASGLFSRTGENLLELL